ncbi:hypothetical protein H310_03121 [Aphanomyces invadans]|uniref:Peptidase C1A papain C-terminal domain-containing protein n=1 Tax=Aphanomyces invadans TaxID=157072 RepID=A0A024ULI4_9STRA|nr:hypothetical protein H310_03121 [Aphanomyces invadans]ETW07035.1 hypothetical protein H310_03121 [Aphanomyces invadans]|eukprot:XP_008865110.1 hypothetical protein H310_03121 [Aphanomyces invadans]
MSRRRRDRDTKLPASIHLQRLPVERGGHVLVARVARAGANGQAHLVLDAPVWPELPSVYGYADPKYNALPMATDGKLGLQPSFVMQLTRCSSDSSQSLPVVMPFVASNTPTTDENSQHDLDAHLHFRVSISRMVCRSPAFGQNEQARGYSRVMAKCSRSCPSHTSTLADERQRLLTIKVSAVALANLDATMDWKNQVTMLQVYAVHHEGRCESCWVFATVGVNESGHCIKTLASCFFSRSNMSRAAPRTAVDRLRWGLALCAIDVAACGLCLSSWDESG